MSMNRRGLLKKGGALGAAAAVAAAVGTVAVAPTAQASGYWWNRLWNHYLPGDVYGWGYMRPKAWGTYQEVFVGNWSLARVPKEGYKQYITSAGSTYKAPFASDYYGDTGLSAPAVIQCLLNVWRENGHGSGSMLSDDGVIGSLTDARIRAFQNWYFGSADGVVGVNTWNALFA